MVLPFRTVSPFLDEASLLLFLVCFYGNYLFVHTRMSHVHTCLYVHLCYVCTYLYVLPLMPRLLLIHTQLLGPCSLLLEDLGGNSCGGDPGPGLLCFLTGPLLHTQFL